MTKEKNTTEEIKEATPEEAKVEVVKKETKKATKKVKEVKEDKVKEVKDEAEEKNPLLDDLEDLPADVKKRLEANKQKKEAKNKKAKGKGKKKKKKVDRKVSVGKVYINSTYNNTIVSIADTEGNIISWANAGLAGFKGPKKSTPYAAQIITRIAVAKAKEFGLTEVSVFIKGVGTGRESAVRALNANGLTVTYIKDVTPIPHNGCRARKPRRV